MTQEKIDILSKVIDLTENYHFSVKRNIYRETLRQLLHVFGNVYYLNGDGTRTKVKCTTGKPDRATGKDANENNLVLPYITIVETGSEESDDRRKVHNLLVNEKIWDEKENRAKRYLSLAPKAININYEINIWAKFNADLDQIRYSIFSLFHPSLDIRTNFSDYTKAFVKSESDINSQQAGDTTDRLVQKTISITVETYLPSPKFLFTNTGEIKSFNAEVTLADTRQSVTEEVQQKNIVTIIEGESGTGGGGGGGGITGPLTLSGSLDDVNLTAPLNFADVLLWNGEYWVASSLGAFGAGTFNHAELNNRELSNAHPQYVLSATNQTLSSLVSNIQTSTINLSSYIAANESSWAAGGGVTDHGALSGLLDNDHPQYASSSVSAQIQSVSSYALGVSSIVSSHINDGTIHFTSGSLSGAYVLTSTNSNLSSLVSNIETSTINLSSTLQSHIASAVHWELSTLNANYLNSSGDSTNAGFYLSSVSATDISATNYYNLPSSTIVWEEAQDIVLYVKNKNPSNPIPKGTPVAVISGTNSGDVPIVEPLSSVNTHVPEAYGFSNHVAGLTKQTIPADDFGYIIVEGILTGLNTDIWNSGDTLYVSSNGQLSNQRPPVPYEAHPVGVVLRSQQNNGSILVKIENMPELNDIVGFNLASSLINGDIIAYDLTTSTFTNTQALNLSGTSRLGTVSATTYLNLPSSVATWNANQLQGRDVANINPAGGDVLVWDSSQSRWEPSAISTGTGSITNNPGGSNGDIQFKNGSTFSGVDSMNYDSATSKLNVTNLSAVNLSATNFTNAKLDDHIASASVHFTSGSLSSYYAASSWVNENFASSIHSHTFSALSGLSDVLVVTPPAEGQSLVWSSTKWVPSSVAGGGAPVDLTPYVLSSTNQALSSLVSNIETSTVGLSSTLGTHIGSAVHWDLATLNTNYINASGDSANAGFFFSSISGTLLSLSSAITNSVPLLVRATSSVSASLMFFSADSGGNITEAARMNFKGIGNLFFGRRSGTALTTGTYNTGIGQEALSFVTTGQYNTAVGEQASERTTGSSNTSLGYFAGYNQNSGSRNTSIGSEANAYVGSTNDNTAVGYQANYTGAASFNVAVGAEALKGNALGPGNIAVGYRSLFRSSSGTGNIGLGYQAGYGFSSTAGGVSSTNNIVIGYNSNTPEGILLSNTIVIGSGTNSTASNQTIIGHPSTSSTILRGTVSSTSLISNSISGTNISGAIVSATTVSAGTLHLGGSDGYLINNNGSIIISAVNGTIRFPQGFEVTGALSGSTVSATTYLNLPTSSLSGLADTQITNPSQGQSLVWNGTKWQASSVAGGGGGGSPFGNTGVIQIKGPDETFSGTNDFLYNGTNSIDLYNGLNLYIASPGKLYGNIEATTANAATFSGTTYLNLPSGTATWNANKIQGRNVSSTSPNTSSVFVYDGNGWTPGYSIFVSSTAPDNGVGNNGDIYLQYGSNVYVLSSTNNVLSSTVSNHISSAVHWTRAQLEADYITASGASVTAGSFKFGPVSATSISATTYKNLPVSSHNQLLNLNADDHPQYVLSATNQNLSSTLSNHISSAVHWELSALNSYYINSSGDSANASFYLQNLSGAVLSGTSISAVNVFPASSAKRNWVFYGDPVNGRITQNSFFWFSGNAVIPTASQPGPSATLFVERIAVRGGETRTGIIFGGFTQNVGALPEELTDGTPPTYTPLSSTRNSITFIDSSGQLEYTSSIHITNWNEGGTVNQLNTDAVSADTFYATTNIFSPAVSASTYSENVITVQGSSTQLYNVVNDCDTYLVNTTTSAVTVVLPNPTANFGRTILVSKVEADGSHRGVTVSGNITDNQLSSITMYDPNESLRFISNGTSWTNLDFQKALGIVLVAKNSTSSLITKGTPLRIIGSQNNVPTIGPVSAVSGHVPEAMGDMPHCIGLSEHDIPPSAFGHVITRGLLYGLDTNSFAAGDDVYIGENGDLINMMPVAPYEQIRVGIVVIGGTTTDGVIYVDLVHPTYINELVGFDIPDTIDDSPSASHYKAIYYTSATRSFTADYIDHGFLVGLGDNDHPQYASSSVSANISTLESNTSTLSSTVTNHIGSAVHWDLATLNSNYINASGDSSNNGFYFSSLSATTLSATTYQNLPTSSLSGLADVLISSTPTTNYVLKWNGTKWAPAADSTGAGGTISNAFTTITDESANSITGTGEDTVKFVSRDDAVSITVDNGTSPQEVNFEINEAAVTHNDLFGLTTGNPHTQYLLTASSSLSSLNFLSLSATTISATNYSGISLSGSLRDVAITTPTNDHVLTWSAAAGKWVSKAAPGSTGGIANGFSIVDINSASYVLNSTGEDTLYLVNGNAIEIVESTTNTVRVAVVENQITHNNLTGLTTGNPHTQYATLSGATFTGGVSAASISATDYFNLPSGTAIWNANKLQGVDVTSTAPTTNQALVYDGTKWTPSSLPAGGGGGVTFLSALSDVSAASPSHKDTLVYNSSVGRYVDTPVTPYRLIVHADAGANITLTNQANTEAFFAGSNRNIYRVDLTNFTQARFHARVVTNSASVNNPRLYAEYATTFTTTVGDYLQLGDISVSASLSTATYVTSNWIELVAGAKADVYIAILQNGGDGTADPALGPVAVEFR